MARLWLCDLEKLTVLNRFCVGAACIGLGFFTIFQSAINYLVDTYLMLAAIALAADMFMRSILAAAFPLFASYCEYSLITTRWEHKK